MGKDEIILNNQTSAAEQDLKPEEEAEERFTDRSDVDVEQVFASTFETTTAQDLHQESDSPVPAPPSTKKPGKNQRYPSATFVRFILKY